MIHDDLVSDKLGGNGVRRFGVGPQVEDPRMLGRGWLAHIVHVHALSITFTGLKGNQKIPLRMGQLVRGSNPAKLSSQRTYLPVKMSIFGIIKIL